jgi:hypothetical protein
MKKFIITVLGVAVFFVGLGSLADKVGATFKSDEKALDIVRKARTAIGGEAAIAEVRSLTITGRTTHSFKADGVERSEQGETEIALQFPDKMSKIVRIGKDDGTGEKSIIRQHDVVVVRKGEGQKVILEGGDGEFTTSDGKKITIVKRADGDATFTTEDGQKIKVRKMEGGEPGVWKSKDGDKGVNDEKHMVFSRSAHPGAHGGMKNNEMLRLTLALLLTAPEGIDVNYTFAGESDVDGTAVNIINAEFGGSNYKLFIGKSSNLPVAMSFIGHDMPRIVKFTHDGPPPADVEKNVMVFTKKLEGEPAKAEQFVRFTDYRSTGGVQLPYKWTTSVGNGPSEVFDVTAYEINPANIAEKFANQKIMVRTAKPTN